MTTGLTPDAPDSMADAPQSPDETGTWTTVGAAADVAKKKKVVVEHDGRQAVVVADGGCFYALDNICVHRGRELIRGVILNGKIVCPGHQWAFALESGWENVKQVCQPAFETRVIDDVVEVLIPPPLPEAEIEPETKAEREPETMLAQSQTDTEAETNAAADADPDRSSVVAWMDAWGAEVAAVDLAAGRRRFAEDVSAFGTHADVVMGRDNLEAQQWSQVWPAIEGFRFLTEDMQVLVSPDRLQAVAITGWTSRGVAEDGVRFDRPGRATVVLRRDALGRPWIGTHTHFSLGRGVPQRSHGSRSVLRGPEVASDQPAV